MTYKIGTTVFRLDPENVSMIVLREEVNNFSNGFWLHCWMKESDVKKSEVFLGHSEENATRIFNTIVEDVFGEVKELA